MSLRDMGRSTASPAAPREKMLIGSGRRTLDALCKNNRFWPKIA